MTTEERLKLILSATPSQLATVDAALTGKPESDQTHSLRLFRLGEAAREIRVSRTTLWRAISEGRLKTVEIRDGCRRIPESALRAFAGATK